MARKPRPDDVFRMNCERISAEHCIRRAGKAAWHGMNVPIMPIVPEVDITSTRRYKCTINNFASSWLSLLNNFIIYTD